MSLSTKELCKWLLPNSLVLLALLALLELLLAPLGANAIAINIWKHRYPFYGGYGGGFYPFFGGYGGYGGGYGGIGIGGIGIGGYGR